MKINGGCTFWARQTIDSDIFLNKPDKWFKIWFLLVNKANHQDNKEFKRGSCFIKYEWIMEKTGATKSEIDHAIRWLKFGKMLATQKATRGMIIFILNYGIYQDIENYKSDSKSDLKATQKRHKSDTINNNDNNDNNIININSLDYLKSISDNDIEEFENKYKTTKSQIIELAEKLYTWCLSSGKRKKNYKAFMQNRLLDKFGKRFEVKNDQPQISLISEEERQQNIERLKVIKEQFKK